MVSANQPIRAVHGMIEAWLCMVVSEVSTSLKKSHAFSSVHRGENPVTAVALPRG